jgi:hypothetical protein
MRRLDGLGPAPDRVEVDHPAVELGLVGRPDRLHRQELLLHQRPPRPRIDAMVPELLDQPAGADAEQKAAGRDVVDRRDLLRERDRVVLGDDADARAQAQAARAGGRGAERGELIEQPGVLAGAVALQQVAPAHRDVGVRREKQ